MKIKLKAGRRKPIPADAHRISDADIADARRWTQRLSKQGIAPEQGGGRVMIPPKLARLFWS